MIGRGWDFRLGRLQKLLVTLINKAGDFGANQVPGLRKDAHSSLGRFFNRSRTVQLFQENAVLRTLRFQNVKAVITKPGDGFVVCARVSFFCHESPVAGPLQIRCRNSPLTAERTDTLAHPAAGRQHYPCAESNPRLWGLPTLAHPLRDWRDMQDVMKKKPAPFLPRDFSAGF